MPRINSLGQLVDEPEITAAVIGCGSHAFRNIFPTFQFAPVRLVATCDLDLTKAQAFASKFGAPRAYDHHRRLLDEEAVDAVFLVLGYDDHGRPQYPALALDCLAAGRHVWMEKPSAASTSDIEKLQAAARDAGREVMVGFKKMFMPANEHARGLIDGDDFGAPSLARLEYPQYVPTVEELERYAGGEAVPGVVAFLDHLCHPASLLLHLLGMPQTLTYERSAYGAGAATFTYASGAIATLDFTWGAAFLDGLERTVVVSNKGRHVVVENNLKVSYHRLPFSGYGDVADFYTAPLDRATAVWEPEFSLGQLYNKGLFTLGYVGEVAEFAAAVLEGRPPAKAGLDHAWQVTRLFEAFAAGPGTRIDLEAR